MHIRTYLYTYICVYYIYKPHILGYNIEMDEIIYL